MEFYVKFSIFIILKWNCHNIKAVIVGLYMLILMIITIGWFRILATPSLHLDSYVLVRGKETVLTQPLQHVLILMITLLRIGVGDLPHPHHRDKHHSSLLLHYSSLSI